MAGGTQGSGHALTTNMAAKQPQAHSCHHAPVTNVAGGSRKLKAPPMPREPT